MTSKTTKGGTTAAVHWFRKGLRLHDNPALHKALEGNPSKVIPLFILDPWFLRPGKIAGNRIAFLLESLQCLDEQLREQGSRLLVAKGNPKDVLPSIINGFDVSMLTYELDNEPYAQIRDADINQICSEMNVTVDTSVSHTLWDPQSIIVKNGNKAPLTYGAFQKVISNIGAPKQPLPVPQNGFGHIPSQEMIQNVMEEHTVIFFDSVPTLDDLSEQGYSNNDKKTPFIGGEKEAINKMTNFLSQTQKTADFQKPMTSPTSIEPDTTALSPYLKFGCLSPRLFYHNIIEVYRQKKKHTQPPVSLLGQLLWREFYYVVSLDTPNYGQMKGNSICKQINWNAGPEIEENLQRWEYGQTGLPAIDAAMNQLREQGWMHHLARHLVACFLTRGDLFIHWEYGRDIFDKYLIDADWCLNNGNWMWLSCSSFFYQYFRIYSPVAFFKKTDPNGDYIRHFVPILKNFPKKYIFEPWKAPITIQRECGCIIGQDYPSPIVDHSTASNDCKGKMAAAYNAIKQGVPLVNEVDYSAIEKYSTGKTFDVNTKRARGSSSSNNGSSSSSSSSKKQKSMKDFIQKPKDKKHRVQHFPDSKPKR